MTDRCWEEIDVSNEMKCLYSYILEEFQMVFTTTFARDLLENILIESQKIERMSDRCEWLSKILPEISLREIRDVLLR